MDRALKKSKVINFDLDKDRLIMFSDLHRGSRDEADDFIRCEDTYAHALKSYLQENWHLALLGDIEELWENSITEVVRSYPQILALEDQFAQQSRLLRIWGNHDDFWRESFVFRHYFKQLFKTVDCRECIVLRCFRDGDFLGEVSLMHGHQGSWTSEKFATISRFFVRYGWRYFQKFTGYKLSGPSQSLVLKSETDHAMYHWALKERKILVCGHTHSPVFMSGTYLDHIDEQLAIHAHDDKESKHWQEEKEKHKERNTHIHVHGHRYPMYFNTGCCSYRDGDITGIEMDGDELRLIKWSAVSFKRTVLHRVSTQNIFSQTKY